MESVESQIAQWRTYVSRAPAVNGHDVEFVRVKGHAGVELNERADQLACEQRDVHAAA